MTVTTFQLEPLDATFGAVVRGIELRALDAETWQQLYAAWLEYGLLVFPGQFLTNEEQVAFAERFNPLEFALAPISNVGRKGVHSDPTDDVVKSLRGNEGWHHDSTYMPVQAKGAVFCAEVVPTEGAATGFADMRAAYDALDDATRAKVADMQAYHSLNYSQGRVGYLPSKKKEDGNYVGYGYDQPPYLRPLVKVHPETGRPNLCIGRHAHNIVGMSPAESEAFLDKLVSDACQPPRIYHHQWEVGDAIVWDNRRLLHRATPFDMSQPRRMWHARIAGDRPSELALNVD